MKNEQEDELLGQPLTKHEKRVYELLEVKQFHIDTARNMLGGVSAQALYTAVNKARRKLGVESQRPYLSRADRPYRRVSIVLWDDLIEKLDKRKGGSRSMKIREILEDALFKKSNKQKAALEELTRLSEELGLYPWQEEDKGS